MKISMATALLVTALSMPAFAQGNVGGADAAGQPINSSIRAPGIDRSTGLSPGSTYHKRVTVKKKRPRTVVQQPPPKGY